MNSKTPIVIPAYEPTPVILDLCKALTEAGLDAIYLVDDGNDEGFDAIFDEARDRYGAHVLRNAVNCGKGRALKHAFNTILNDIPDCIGCVTADSDGQHTPEDIKKCMDALISNPDKLVLGCRRFDGDDVPWKSRYGNLITRKVCSFLCGVSVSDTQTGLRGIPADFMRELLNIKGERFEFETNMLIACRDHIEIEEVPIQTVYDSKDDHVTHFDPIRDSIRIYSLFGRIFVKYIFSSLSSSVVDLVLFWLFCFLMRESAPGTYVVMATVIARIISATYNYTLNYKVVFKSRESVGNTSIRYILLAIAQMSASALLVWLISGVLKIVPEVVIKAIIDTILFFVSYYIQQRFVFARREVEQ